MLATQLWLFETPWTVAHQASLSTGILQARILEWVALPSSRESSQPRDWTQVFCTGDKFFIIWATREAHKTLHQILPGWDTWFSSGWEHTVSFAWQSNKAILFCFTQNSCLQDLIQYQCTEAKLSASLGRRMEPLTPSHTHQSRGMRDAGGLLLHLPWLRAEMGRSFICLGSTFPELSFCLQAVMRSGEGAACATDSCPSNQDLLTEFL